MSSTLMPADCSNCRHVHHEFVRDAAVLSLEQNREVRLQALGHVVGVEDRDLRRARQAGAAHQGDVDPGNEQDAGAAVRGGGDRADGCVSLRCRGC